MTASKEEQLKELISKCKEKLKKLQPHLEISEVTNTIYNKILIEKAIYQNELKTLKASFFRRLLKSVKVLNPSSKYYICDYFK